MIPDEYGPVWRTIGFIAALFITAVLLMSIRLDATFIIASVVAVGAGLFFWNDVERRRVR